MNELPSTKGITSIFDQYGEFADPRDLAALIMIESQDSIFAAFEDGIKDRVYDIETLNKARNALVVAIAYAQEAESADEKPGNEASENEVVVIEAEDAAELHEGITCEEEPPEPDEHFESQCHEHADNERSEKHNRKNDRNRDQDEPNAKSDAPEVTESKHSTDLPEQEAEVEEILDTYEEGEDWKLTVGDLRLLIDVLTNKVKVLGTELSSMADNAIKFLEESEDSIHKINAALRQTEIDPLWIDKLTGDKNDHFEMKDFLRRIEEMRQEEKNQQAKRKDT